MARCLYPVAQVCTSAFLANLLEVYVENNCLLFHFRLRPYSARPLAVRTKKKGSLMSQRRISMHLGSIRGGGSDPEYGILVLISI